MKNIRGPEKEAKFEPTMQIAPPNWGWTAEAFAIGSPAIWAAKYRASNAIPELLACRVMQI
jgi:hypothetical protein